MADYYTKFSFIVFGEYLEVLQKALGALEENDPLLNEIAIENPDVTACDFELQDFELNTKGLWLWSEDFGDIPRIINTIAWWQRKYKKTDIVSFEWCNTCSKPRTDGFGGGAVVIYKGNSKFINTYNWICKETDKIKKRQK